MPQILRPDADVSAGAWAPTPTSPTTLYDKVDEVTRSDADYISSEQAPSSSAAILGLTSGSDPVSSANHDLNYAIRKDASGGSQIDATVELVEDPSGTPVARATYNHTDVANTWTEYNQTLSGGEADSITDYADLGIRITANQV